MDIQHLQTLLQEKYNKHIILFENNNCWQCSSHKTHSEGYYYMRDFNNDLHLLHRVVYSLVNGIQRG